MAFLVAPLAAARPRLADAPAARSGDGDVDTTGACKADIGSFCSSTKPGEGRLAACLSNQADAEAAGTAAGSKLALECVEELRQFKIDRCGVAVAVSAHGVVRPALTRPVRPRSAPLPRARSALNITKDLALATACKDDADKYCTDENIFPEPGAVLTCLRRAPRARAAPRGRDAPDARRPLPRSPLPQGGEGPD